ncbi:MAG: class I SAM-dependent methyltransferase, partial [Chloroflexota bacterium]|nr:class I SAM-dependent methyltransferase [Chloroflexota bacterium]
MTESQTPVKVAPIGSVDAIVQSLAPDAWYQSPGGRTFLIAASMLGGIARGASVLDVSSGIGQASVDLAEAFGCKVTAFDNFPPYLAFGRQLAIQRNLNKLVSFIELDGKAVRSAFEPASFDVVLGMGGGLGDVLPGGIAAGLEAAAGWLKPGGLLICGDLISPATVSPLMEIVFGGSLVDERSYLEAVRTAGFEPIFVSRATSADWDTMRATIASLRQRNLVVGTDDE